MSHPTLRERWNEFFFAPRSPLPLGLFRILYGTMVVITLLVLRSEWFNWYGAHPWITAETMHIVEPGVRLNLFRLLPPTDAWANAYFWVMLLVALLFTVGLFTRINSVLLFVLLTSLHQRNLFMTHGGDTFLRVAGFFLMFAPAGAALSLDRYFRVRRGRESRELPLCRPWAQRMIQFELSLVYLTSFFWKTQGAPWINGTALYYVYHLDAIRRFPLPPFFLNPFVLKIGTWFALVLELSLATLIWVRRFRYPLLVTGACFHLFLEYSLNVPLFEWDILTAYVLFVDPQDIERAGQWLRKRLGVSEAAAA